MIEPNDRIHQREASDEFFEFFEFTLVDEAPAALAHINELIPEILKRRGWKEEDVEFLMNIDMGEFVMNVWCFYRHLVIE